MLTKIQNLNNKLYHPALAGEILRLGLATVFLWFGFSQIFDSLQWVSVVPDWAVNFLHIPPAMIVLGNGLIEIILGGMLALGFWVRISALILALHLLVITLEMGISPVGVRDLGLTLATLALAMSYRNKDETMLV